MVDSKWSVVRNFDDFKKHILTYGIPEVISFDHDLGEDSQGSELPSGYDAIKWLVDFDQKYSKLPGNWQIRIHSANPVGCANIQGYYDNYKHFLNNNR